MVMYEQTNARLEQLRLDLGVEPVERFEEALELDGDIWVIYHVGADNKVIDVAGVHNNEWKAWWEADAYCRRKGLDPEKLARSRSEFIRANNEAWREKFPKEAAKYDAQRAAVKKNDDPDVWA